MANVKEKIETRLKAFFQRLAERELYGVLCFGSGQTLACGFDGPIKHGDGSGVSGGSGVRVTSSWNSERAQFPRQGYYFLELGPNACGQKIELYVNGYSMGRYNVPNRGMATVPVKLKGNTPDGSRRP